MTKPGASEQPLSVEGQKVRLLHAVGRKILAESESLGRLEEFVGIVHKRRKSRITFSQKLLSHFGQRLRMKPIQELQPKGFRRLHCLSPS